MFRCHFLYFSPQKKFLPFVELLVQAADQDRRHLLEKREGAADPDSSGKPPNSGSGQRPRGAQRYLLAFGAAQDFLDSQPLRLHVFIFALVMRDVGELPGFGFCKTFSKGKKITSGLRSAFRWNKALTREKSGRDSLAALRQKAICVC